VGWPRTAELCCVGLMASACAPPDKLEPMDLDAADGPVAGDFSSELDLVERFVDEIETPFLALEEGSFSGVDGVTIRYRVSPVDAAKGAVVLLPGRTEAVFKHAENIFDLNAQGYTVYAMDHRGHGASDRMVEDSDMCHVEWFMDYVDDLATLMDDVVAPEQDIPLFLLAHSMGGAVAGLYLWEHPDVFDGVVLTSPMFGLDTGAFPPALVQTLGTGICSGTDGTGYTLGHGPYDPEHAFEDTQVTQSQVRFDLKKSVNADYPELRLGGASWRWVCESMWAAEHLPRLGRHTPTRTLVLQAGDELVVLPEAEDAWCDDAPGCQLVVIDGGRHELLSESDVYRNETLALTVRYLDALVEAL